MEELQTYIGSLAVKKGYVTEDKVRECIDELDSEESSKKIDDILLEKKLLNETQLKQLQSRRKLNIKKMEGQALLEYIKKMKIVKDEKLEKVLDIQRKASMQKTYIPLPIILVSHGLLTQEQVDKIRQKREVQRIVREAVWKNDPRRSGLIGRVLGGYEIQSKIAAGGMGVVYKALHLELNRTVALKILFEKFASNKKYLKQFFREARLSAMFNHPNLVHLFEMGQEQGFYYYSMELVEGTNFGDYVKEKVKLPQYEAREFIVQAGKGLEHMHAFDIVHLDIKPSNFIIRDDKILKIMDLGLARELSNIPKKRATMGTPFYMAPELIYNPELNDQRVDIYALGVSFYKILTGEYPISGNTPKEILEGISSPEPAKPITEYDSAFSPELSNVIQKMIAKDPQKRYHHMTDVLNDLDRILLI